MTSPTTTTIVVICVGMVFFIAPIIWASVCGRHHEACQPAPDASIAPRRIVCPRCGLWIADGHIPCRLDLCSSCARAIADKYSGAPQSNPVPYPGTSYREPALLPATKAAPSVVSAAGCVPLPAVSAPSVSSVSAAQANACPWLTPGAPFDEPTN